jgi:hypothetical protein
VQRNRRSASKRNPHCCRAGNRRFAGALIGYFRREAKIMRWKISHGDHGHRGHDPRQIDLIAIVALLIAILAAFRFYSTTFDTAPSTTAFIVPSQSVHW